MRRILSFLLSLVMVMGIITSVSVSVLGASVSDLRFTLSDDGKSYSVTDCRITANGELVIPQTYNNLPVETIGYGAFEECEEITSVVIPGSVINIEGQAFKDCIGLESVTMLEGVLDIGEKAFFGCEKLASVVIPDSVETIGYGAFEECEDITSVVIPGSVINIEEQAFKDCIGLESVTIQDGVLDIGEKAFFGCEKLASVVIPDSVEHISKAVFDETELYNNNDNWENDVLYIGNHIISAKTTISGDCYIKAGTRTIADFAFEECCLESVSIPNGIIEIPTGAFSNCSELAAVVIPDSLVRLGAYAFYGCESLESIEIPDATTSIGEYAFYNCTELYSITLPEHYIEIGEAAFYGTGYYYDSFNWENGILYVDNHLITVENAYYETYEIKETTISIANNAFEYCKNIKKFDLPDSVLGIGDSAFIGCDSLEKVSFGKNLKTIGDFAFSGTNIVSIKLPENLEVIGSEALTSVESAVIPRKIKYIGAYVFGSSFKYLFYTGSKTEWKKVIIDSDNSFLLNSAIHYNSTDHTLVDGSCKKCDYSWFVFELFEDDYYGESYYMLDYCKTIAKGDIVIPRKYKGLPVLGIDGYAFQDCKKVTSVVIQKGVTRINTATFLRCSNLKSVTIPESVVLIDEAAFYKCDKISKVYYLGSAKSWEEIYIKGYNDKLLKAKLYCVPDKTELKSLVNTATGVKLSWNKVKGADNYEIYRKTGSSKWVKIATVKGTITSYTDKTAKSGTTYKYTIKAKNEVGVSKYNTTGLTIKYLADPTLKTPTSAKNGITLKWSKVTGAQGYMVYRKTGNGSYSKLATVKGVSKTSYIDKSAKKNKKYTYKVKAYYGKTYSAYSNTKTIKDKY